MAQGVAPMAQPPMIFVAPRVRLRRSIPSSTVLGMAKAARVLAALKRDGRTDDGCRAA
jgi:hypothetical protein